MDWVKKNKVLFGGLVAFVVILLVIVIALWDILIPNNGSEYGNRLDGIEEMLPGDSVIDTMLTELEAIDKIKSVSYTRSGKILNFIIDVEPGTDKASNVSYANKILEYLTDGQKGYFDIQVYFTCKSEELGEGVESIYPFIAYKHRTGTVFTTTNTD